VCECEDSTQENIQEVWYFLKLIKAVWEHALSETDADKDGKIVLPFPIIISLLSVTGYENRYLATLKLGG
jgi:hypothetical protein